MTAEHFDGLLDALLDRSSFQPFTIELARGHQFDVDQLRATVVRDGVAVFLRPGGAPVWFDDESVTEIGGDSPHSCGRPKA
ncbi:MAG TPA: hypothetical protein VFI31_27590 [Pirellulales bacterium]|nr:hypothetical protein [Pirellulales bacterium]